MIVAIIQARMASTRLPGKVLANIAGKPMLWQVVQRVRAARSIDNVVVATSSNPSDDPIAAQCAVDATACFRGDEDDVLDRFYRAALRFGADTVVRITADCPLMDPVVIDKVVSTFRESDCDYVSNTLRYTYPDGLDVEVFSLDALERTWKNATSPHQREHVTQFMRQDSSFLKRNVEHSDDLSPHDYRWTVDDPADLAFVQSVYAWLSSDSDYQFGLDDVLELVKRHPEMQAGNDQTIPNQGLYQSLAESPPIPIVERSLIRSAELQAQATAVIPSVTQTFSKGPSQYVQGVAPGFLVRGAGSHVWDVDGNEYIDYPMALGPVILGYNYPAVSDAAIAQIKDGAVFSLAHPLEIEVSEMLVDLIPCAEMVRFGKNGSDVTSGAVRAARAYTGRDIVACCGYHGWQDWFIGTTTRSIGVPEAVRGLTVPFVYNDIASLEQVFADHPGQVAAVIMEPIGIVEPQDDFLQKVRSIATREGAVLVFDEVVTGFRIAMGGAQQHYGVTPDLACFGKAMGNGFPISAVVGRRDIMSIFNEAFFSFTFGGEAVSLAAAKATIREMVDKNVIAELWSSGRQIKDGFNVFAEHFGIAANAHCQGLSPHTVSLFKDAEGRESLELKSLFQQECLKRGVLFLGPQNISYSHSSADIERTLLVYRTAMEICAIALREGDVVGRLEGPVVQPVFRSA